jgi:hypothetical protein
MSNSFKEKLVCNKESLQWVISIFYVYNFLAIFKIIFCHNWPYLATSKAKWKKSEWKHCRSMRFPDIPSAVAPAPCLAHHSRRNTCLLVRHTDSIILSCPGHWGCSDNRLSIKRKRIRLRYHPTWGPLFTLFQQVGTTNTCLLVLPCPFLPWDSALPSPSSKTQLKPHTPPPQQNM